MTLLQFLLLTSGLALLAAAGIIWRLMQRMTQAAPAPAQTPLALDDANLDAISRRIADGLGASQDTGLDTISAKIDQLRAEFDWVVGESLIHQAVSLARSGQSEGEIAQATGISADELQAIRRFRRH